MFRVAERLGKTISELGDSMTMGELLHWGAHFQSEAEAGRR